MADENQIEFLFTGDQTDVNKAFDDVEARSADLAATVSSHFDETGSAAEDAASKVSDYASAAGDVGSESEKAKPHVEDLGHKFLEVGASAGGATEGIRGVEEGLNSLTGLFGRASNAFHGFSPEFAEGMRSGAEATETLSANTGFLATAMETLTNPVGLVVAGILALSAAEVGAAFALKDMAESATQEGNQLFLMAEKTGISVENLGALEVGADLAGTSLQRIVTTITMLQYRMTQHTNATKGAGKALHDLHLDTQDANHALEQMFTHLSKIPEGAARTTEAMRLMGPRMGRDFGVLVTEMGGSVEEFDKKLTAMGITLSTTEARGAHDFTVQLKLLETQWENLKRQIEITATPLVREWISDISSWFTRNHDEIVAWGRSFVAALESIIPKLGTVATTISVIIDDLRALAQLTPINIVINVIKSIKSVGEEWQAQDAATVPTGKDVQNSYNKFWGIHRSPAEDARMQGRLDSTFGKPMDLWGAVTSIKEGPAPPPYHPSGGGGGKHKGGADPYAHEMKMEEERLKQALAGYQHETTQWEQMFQRKQISMETFTIQSINLEVARSKATMDSLQKEYDAASRLKKPAEREEKQLAIVGKMQDEKFRLEKAGADKLDALDKERMDRFNAREQGLLTIFETTHKQEEDEATDLAKHRVITEVEATDRIIESQMGLMRIKKLQLEGSLANEQGGSAAYIRIQMQIGQMEAAMAAAEEANARKRIEATHAVLEDAIQFTASMRALDQEILGSKLQLSRALLDHRIATGGMSDPNDQRESKAALDRIEENARYQQQVESLHERFRVESKDQTYARILQLNDRYHRLTEVAEDDHIARLKTIDERRLEDMHAALIGLSDTWANTLSNSIAEGFKNGIGAGVKSFERGLLEMVQSIAMRELKKELLAIFDDLSGRGGALGKLFEIITGVHKGKAGTADMGGLIATSGVDTAKESAAAMTKITSSITVAGAQQTKELIGAGALRAKELQATITSGIEHLCACSQPTQQGFLSTILQAAVGAAIGSAVGGLGHKGQTDEGPATDQSSPPTLKPFSGHHAGGGSFGPNQSFEVGERGPETVFTNERGGFVVPNGGGISNTGGPKQVNITLNAPVLGSSGYSAPRSRREYLEMLAPQLVEALNNVY